MRRETCGYWVRRGTCKFGDQCRFLHESPNHHRNSRFSYTDRELPVRPGHRLCNAFARTGRCPFGSRCKYDHHLTHVLEKAPVGTLPSHYSMKPRRMRSHQDMHRFKSYAESGRAVSSKGWHSGGSEQSPRPCTDTSPRSTIDAGGSFRHSCSPQSTQTQTSPLPEGPCYGDGGYTHEGVDNGHHLANLFHQSLEHSALVSHCFQPDYLTWPFISSQWYASGVPNQVMQRRMEEERDMDSYPIPTAPSHFLKPYRSQEGTFMQVIHSHPHS